MTNILVGGRPGSEVGEWMTTKPSRNEEHAGRYDAL
jgi:hypothetical protein